MYADIVAKVAFKNFASGKLVMGSNWWFLVQRLIKSSLPCNGADQKLVSNVYKVKGLSSRHEPARNGKYVCVLPKASSEAKFITGRLVGVSVGKQLRALILPGSNSSR
jgi:hypothetical protein